MNEPLVTPEPVVLSSELIILQPLTFKERIFKQLKLMNIGENGVLYHTIEKHFSTIENKEEQVYIYIFF